MSRIRTVKPDFYKDEDLSALPPETHMLAAALLNYADDEGYFNANPMLVKAECCPLREDSTTIRRSLDDLSSIGYLRLGNGVDGKSYGWIVNFKKHQRVDRPKPSLIKDLCTFDDESTNNRRVVPVGREGKGREGNNPLPPCEGESVSAGVENPVGDLPDLELAGEEELAEPSERPPTRAELRKATRAEKSRKRFKPAGALMKDLGALVPGRGRSRPWTWEEAEALMDLGNIEAEELAAVAEFYHAEHPAEKDYRRRKLVTLLNHWTEEVVKAQVWLRERSKVAAGDGRRFL
jgi:hypothetical protein